MPKRTTWVLFDGDCRICTALARWAAALDARHAISIRPLQDAQGLLPGVPGDEILHAMRAVTADGCLLEGGSALLGVAAALAGGERLEMLLRRSRLTVRFANRGYGVLVQFRGHLTCRVPSEAGANPARTGAGHGGP